MKRRDVADLTLLAALWGGSFLFMRVAVPEFGPVALSAMRVAGAALLLLPLLAARGQLGALRAHWQPIGIVGITNSALPFLGFAYAASSLEAGLSSIFNSTSPLFAAVIAWAWLGDRLTPARLLGLVIGFGGVVWIAWDRSGLKAGGSAWAVAACMVASLFYGWSSAFARKRLVGVPPLAVAAGSQLSATLALAVPAAFAWPAVAPSAFAWSMTAVLAVVCTGLAYILYFRLIANVGSLNAIAVTFLVPIFAVLWGGLFLHERLTLPLLAGCAVIFIGTALATGLLRLPARRPAPTSS